MVALVTIVSEFIRATKCKGMDFLLTAVGLKGIEITRGGGLASCGRKAGDAAAAARAATRRAPAGKALGAALGWTAPTTTPRAGRRHGGVWRSISDSLGSLALLSGLLSGGLLSRCGLLGYTRACSASSSGGGRTAARASYSGGHAAD